MSAQGARHLTRDFSMESGESRKPVMVAVVETLSSSEFPGWRAERLACKHGVFVSARMSRSERRECRLCFSLQPRRDAF